MSNERTGDRIQFIVDEVSDVWILTDRDDLLDDCISYVEDIYGDEQYSSLAINIDELVIAFLSMKCADAMSTADLKAMAIEDQERKSIRHAGNEDNDWQTNYNNATEHEIYGVNPLDYEK